MTMRRRLVVLAPLLGLLASACTTGYTTQTDTATGRTRIYALSRQAALAIAHDAIAESFPDSTIEADPGPPAGFSAGTRSAFDTSRQTVAIHPVKGVTAAGATVDGYTFTVSSRGTIGAGDINTATFFARLQQKLDATGDEVDVARVEPRVEPP